jgi:hypothetical protein
VKWNTVDAQMVAGAHMLCLTTGQSTLPVRTQLATSCMLLCLVSDSLLACAGGQLYVRICAIPRCYAIATVCEDGGASIRTGFSTIQPCRGSFQYWFYFCRGLLQAVCRGSNVVRFILFFFRMFAVRHVLLRVHSLFPSGMQARQVLPRRLHCYLRVQDGWYPGRRRCSPLRDASRHTRPTDARCGTSWRCTLTRYGYWKDYTGGPDQPPALCPSI